MRPRPVEGKGHLEMTMAPSRIRRCHCNRPFRVPANLMAAKLLTRDEARKGYGSLGRYWEVTCRKLAFDAAC